jgi:MYXO-CTERM domain-containing protein
MRGPVLRPHPECEDTRQGEKNMMRTLMGATLLAALAGSANAQVQMTEIYAGVSGPDGTADWFELTNFGAVTVNTSGWFYDDDSADPTKNDALSALDILPGESVVFLVSWEDSQALVADAITDFENVWGAGIKVGYVTGGSGLGNGASDGAFVFDANIVGAATIASGSFNALTSSGQETIEFSLTGHRRNSVLGENGAYESLVNVGNAATPLIGSPGAVPTPGAIALAGLAGLAGARRRRK